MQELMFQDRSDLNPDRDEQLNAAHRATTTIYFSQMHKEQDLYFIPLKYSSPMYALTRWVRLGHRRPVAGQVQVAPWSPAG